jgi:hypothetical protein
MAIEVTGNEVFAESAFVDDSRSENSFAWFVLELQEEDAYKYNRPAPGMP